MEKLNKKFIFIALLTMAVVSLVFAFQYKQVTDAIRAEAEQTTHQRTEALAENINDWIDSNSSAIDDLADVVVLLSENEMRDFLSDKLQKSEEFTSLYYITGDLRMIHASGFIPPPHFDVTLRPWYQKAIQSKEVIVTDAFLNASRNDIIVTIAKAVRDESGEIIGVAAGDISTQTIAALLMDQNSGQSDLSIIIDQKHEPVSLSYNDHTLPEDSVIINQIKYFFSLGETEAPRDEAIETYLVGKNLGLLSYEPLRDTPWTVVTFISLDRAMAAGKTVKEIYYMILATLMITFFLVLYLLRKNLILPMLNLEKNIANIDVENHPTYRIDVDDHKEFKKLGLKINDLLEKMQTHIDEIKSDKEQLKSAHHELEALFMNSPNAVVHFDQKHQVVNVNPQFSLLFKYALDEIKGKDLDDVVDAFQIFGDARILTQRVMSGEAVTEEVKRMTKDGLTLELEAVGIPIIKNSEFCGGYVIYSDITARKRSESKILYMSYHDQLTGLYNRRFLEEEMNRLDNQRNLPISIIMIDLNDLKLANDAFGHLKGDELLVHMAQSIKAVCRQDEIVARYGGDEFVILLPKTSELYAQEILSRIKEKTREAKLELIDLSFSAGIATKVNLDENLHAIMKQADDRMYHQKLFESNHDSTNIIQTITKTLHEKNWQAEEHSKRVSELSGQIAQALGYPETQVKEIIMLGHLHDIGKVGIEEAILNKKGRLTDDEWKAIRQHPEIGHRILSEINGLGVVADNVLAHHERCDGAGYPNGLSCEDIPKFAKIIAVADAYDAMTSERPYRHKKTTKEAVEELEKCSGTQFDPEVVDIFVNLIINQSSQSA